MNDLIKRIDAVFAKKEINVGDLLADCRAALEAKGEPVAYRHWCECDMDEAGNPVYDWEYFDKASCPECVPLYTAPPPSVDSITNEIIGNLYEMVMELTEPNNSSEELKAKYRASVVNLFEVNDELQKR